MVDLILACAIVFIFIIPLPGFIPSISYRIKKLREPYPQSIRNYKQIVEIVIDGLFGGIFGVISGSIFEYIYIRVLFLSDISSAGTGEFTYAIMNSAEKGILIGGSLGGVVTYYIVRKTDAWPSRVYLAIGGFGLSSMVTLLSFFMEIL